MDSGSIAAWNMSEGDKFKAGDAICSIRTDKCPIDWEADDDGVLAKILVPAVSEMEASEMEVACGAPVMIVVDDVEHVSAFANYTMDPASTTAPVPPT
jgi:pyruvate dehydrogenase E2 component (dihydrolipoamide acetyltransferase)